MCALVAQIEEQWTGMEAAGDLVDVAPARRSEVKHRTKLYKGTATHDAMSSTELPCSTPTTLTSTLIATKHKSPIAFGYYFVRIVLVFVCVLVPVG